MKNKTEVIQKLNTKNQMHENAIKTLTELINSTQEQFNDISVKNKETYEALLSAYLTKLDELHEYVENRVSELEESKRILVTSFTLLSVVWALNITAINNS